MIWQPIETAPKDGRDIWLYFPLEGLDPRTWDRVISCYWKPGFELWVWSKRAVRSYSRGYDPTHWQPLTDETPQPPEGI